MTTRSSLDSAQEGWTVSGYGQPADKILIVDDERPVRRVLHTTLRSLGFDVGEASSGEEAAAICRISRYDAVLLDINMAGKGGIATCAELRNAMPQLAILMVTVTDDYERIVEALEAGADDYIVKPFHMRELTARIRAALRRARAKPSDSGDAIVIGGLSLHPERRLVQKSGHTIRLTPKEFDLLRYLMTHPGRPITHERLLAAVWGPQYTSRVEYLRTFMRRLRLKLQDHGDKPKYLLTVSHIGYRFADPVEWLG